MSRRPIFDISPLDWLPLGDDAPTVCGLPVGFAAYHRILPPLGIDRSIPLAAYSFATRTVDQLKARVSFWNAHGIQQGQPAPERLTRITYRQAAAELGVDYTSTFGDKAIRRVYGEWPPNLGTSLALEVALVQQLVAVLGPQTDTYFFGTVAEGMYQWDAQGMPTDWLERGKAEDLVDLYQQERRWPTYTFAADHKWCLYQGEDNEWLALGCSTEVKQTLRAQTTLEILPLMT